MKLQSADAFRDAARNPSGGAAAGVGIGMGAAMAQQAMAPAARLRCLRRATDRRRFRSRRGTTWCPANDAARRTSPVFARPSRADRFGRDTLVWTRGMAEWAAAQSVTALGELLAGR